MAHKYYYQMNLNSNDNILEVLPKTGCWGIILFFITMILGAKFCISKKSFKDSYEYYKPRIICAAPIQYKRIMKEEKTAIAAALPKCITASILEVRLDRKAILSLAIASSNARKTPASPTFKARLGE